MAFMMFFYVLNGRIHPELTIFAGNSFSEKQQIYHPHF